MEAVDATGMQSIGDFTAADKSNTATAAKTTTMTFHRTPRKPHNVMPGLDPEDDEFTTMCEFFGLQTHTAGNLKAALFKLRETSLSGEATLAWPKPRKGN